MNELGSSVVATSTEVVVITMNLAVSQLNMTAFQEIQTKCVWDV